MASPDTLERHSHQPERDIGTTAQLTTGPAAGPVRRIVVLDDHESPPPYFTEGEETIFLQQPGGRPDVFVKHPHRYFSVVFDSNELDSLAREVLTWYHPASVKGTERLAGVVTRVEEALGRTPSGSATTDDAHEPGGGHSGIRTLLLHKHVADVLYGSDGDLLPAGVDIFYLTHALGGLDVYDPDAFARTWVVDCANLEEVRVLSVWAIRHFALDRVVTLHEKLVRLAAELRAALGLGGLQTDQAEGFRDKAVMKQRVRTRTTLRVPEFRVLETANDFDGFEHGDGGIVVKPIDGLGAENIQWYANLASARAAWVAQPPTVAGRYEVEEFVEGTNFHVDSIVADGQVQLVAVSEYLTPPMDLGPGRDLSSVMHVDGELAYRLKRANADVLMALELEAGVGHVEFFVTPHGELVFCEAAARPGGAGVDRVMSRSLGVSVVAAALSLESGLAVHVPDTEPRTTGWLGFYPDPERSGGLDRRRFADLGIVEHRHNPFAGAIGGVPRHSVEFVDRFIVEANGVDTFKDSVEQIRREYWT